MEPAWVGRFPRGIFLLVVFTAFSYSTFSQTGAAFLNAREPPHWPANCGRTVLVYLGGYHADGKFRAASPFSCGEEVTLSSDSILSVSSRPPAVPSFIYLHPRERVIENYQPPAYAKRAIKGTSTFAALRDGIVTFAYGREKALLTPIHVAVDSQGRLIVSDPGAGAVHVLDGRNSFRIAAGANRRMHMPAGVAVDAADNIYVADPDLGVVGVYDRSGRFLHDIGKMGGETLFHSPTGIAIDSKNNRLYVLDTPRSVLFVSDLEGNVLKRVGRGRGHPIGRYTSTFSPMNLDEPTEIAVSGDKVAMLDSKGSRIRIMDLDCNVLAEFHVQVPTGSETAAEVGLGIDASENLYLSNAGEPTIRIYDLSGHLKSSFGRHGSGIVGFTAPSGLSIDSANKLYVADTSNRRVEVFQLIPPTSRALASTERRPEPMGGPR